MHTHTHTHTHTHLCFILSFLECCVCKDDFHECHKACYSIFVLIPIVSSLYKRSACFHSWLSVQKVYSFPFFILCTKGLSISIYSSLHKRLTDFYSWFSVQKVNSFPFLVLCTEGLLISIVCSLFKRSTPILSSLLKRSTHFHCSLFKRSTHCHCSMFKRSAGHCTPWLASSPVLIVNGLHTDFCENRSPIACMVSQSASSDNCYCAEFCLDT